jgi:hypothetical protein
VPRKKKPKEEPKLVQLIRQGAERVRLPDWPEGRHVRLKFPGPEGDLYEGDRRLRAYTIDWNDPDWEKIET